MVAVAVAGLGCTTIEPTTYVMMQIELDAHAEIGVVKPDASGEEAAAEVGEDGAADAPDADSWGAVEVLADAVAQDAADAGDAPDTQHDAPANEPETEAPCLVFVAIKQQRLIDPNADGGLPPCIMLTCDAPAVLTNQTCVTQYPDQTTFGTASSTFVCCLASEGPAVVTATAVCERQCP